MVITSKNEGYNLQETQEWVASLKNLHPDKHILLVQNKADLSPALPVQSSIDQPTDFQISALNGTGISQLKEKLVELTLGDYSIQDETIVSNARHHAALQLTAAALERAQEGLQGHTTADFIAMDIREAMRQLGHISGQIDIDTDILGTIFSKFCIGK